MVHDIIHMTSFPLGILHDIILCHFPLGILHDIILCHFPLGICLTSSVLLQQKLNNSVVEVLEEGLELGADGGLGGTTLVEPFLESSEGSGGHVRVRGLVSNSVVRTVELPLVGNAPDYFQVSMDGQTLLIGYLEETQPSR